MKLYDSLTRKFQAFPTHDGPVSAYACGPTVYHYATIGNLRTFLTVDLLRRWLEASGREVKLVMNITDVGHMLNDADVGEDKMEAAAAKEGKTPWEIAKFYEKAFFDDLDALNFKRAWKHPRATEHIPEMVALVEKLLDQGRAYVTEKGDVYFDVRAFGGYGKLSGNTVEELVAGARVDVKEDKRHPADFALWINNPKHVMQWKGPRGIQGYPGWHLECSAMAQKYLGETIDLHAGGEDLKFPHHECEIAQSESATGAPFSRHWLHVSFLLAEGEKMSKSKGNFYTLNDLLVKGHSAAAIRLLLLSAHYRSQLNFTLEGLKAAEKTLRSFRELTSALRKISSGGCGDANAFAAAAEAERALTASLDDDLNVSGAWAAAHELSRALNKAMADGALGPDGACHGLRFYERFDAVFGVGLLEEAAEEAPAEVARLAEERAAARAEKRWADSDRLRDGIAALGWIVEDGPEGQKLKKKIG